MSEETPVETPVATTKTKKPRKAKESKVGKAVAESDIVSLVEVVKAHGPLSSATAQLPSAWVSVSDVLVEFDDRMLPAANQSDIDRDLALSIFIDGQKQPAVVYPDDADGRYCIIAGRTRRRAVKLINDGFRAIDPRTNEEVEFHDPERKLWVVIDGTKSKEDAFVEALKTNILVTKLDDVQEARAVQHLMSAFNWSLTEAARLFGYNHTNRAARLVKLLTLEQEVIDGVQSGRLALDTAVSLATLKPDVRLGILTHASDTDGYVNGSAVKERLRDLYSAGNSAAGEILDEAGDKPPAGTGGNPTPTPKEKKTDEPKEPTGPPPRNAAALKAYIDEEIASNADATFGQKQFFVVLKGFLAGSKSSQQLSNAVTKYIA